MEKIFTIFDKFDTKNDGTIDLVTVSMSKWSGAMQDIFFNYENKTKEFTFSEKK